MICGSLVSPTLLTDGEPAERGNETNETESRRDLESTGGIDHGQRRQNPGGIG